MPKPKAGETRNDYLTRCMGSAEANASFPDAAQRYAVCSSMWDQGTSKQLKSALTALTSFIGLTPIAKKIAPLYVFRPLENVAEVRAWARGQGLETVVEDLHVTLAFSKNPVDWFGFPEAWPERLVVKGSGPRTLERLGEAVVLRFQSSELQWRWQELTEGGASWDWPEYQPHLTLTYQAPADLDLEALEPYRGDLVFGPEDWREAEEDWRDGVTEKHDTISGMEPINLYGTITKVDQDQRLAYGWFSVIAEAGEPVVDAHGDVISEEDLVKAAHGFVLDSRAGKLMHKGRRVADVVDSIVFTEELQKALGIDLGKVGWFGTMKIRDDEVWQEVKSGRFGAFSIGGVAQRKVIE